MVKPKASKRVSKQAEDDERLTLQILDAISSDENECSDGDGNEEWNAEALALRQAVAEGAFNHLLKSRSRTMDNDDKEEDMTEIRIDDNEMEDHDGDDDRSDKNYLTNTEHQTGETNEKDQREDQSEDPESSDDDDEKSRRVFVDSNGKALTAVYEELCAKKRGLAWSESFVVLPVKPLPFGGDDAGSLLDVHDDLKRELAFYNMALDAVNEARMTCRQIGIPFSRPDDFFAEMVKSDGKSLQFFLSQTCALRAATRYSAVVPNRSYGQGKGSSHF